MTDAIGEALRAASRRAEARVEAALAPAPGRVAEAMRYALHGGKGLRAFLVLEGGRLHGQGEAGMTDPAAAIECIHAYSLIHDDLPCMDDDDLRRGRPTVHRAFDEATAVLAGDALQALAFDLLAGAALPDGARLALLGGLARAAGIFGMVGGQAADIAAENAPAPLDLDAIIALQKGKTGALIEWSATAGAVAAGADPAPLARYGAALGLAFQIRDDVLDVEGDAAAVGKALGKDAAAGKATFVSLLGLEPAKARAQSLVDEACDALSAYGKDAATLQAAARFVVSRGH